MEGQTLGNYRILQKLGEGGMGTVYLARDLTLERDVAIKIIAPQLTQNPRLMARFKVEAIAQARLNHPNIITIHAFDQQQDNYYIVMEYIEGTTLKNVIKECGSLPLPQSLAIVYQILDGLIYAHSRGVLHRDIKPANIFVTPRQNVKIGDFGIAKVEGIDGLTRVGSPLGTPLYSAPEQILGQSVGVTADVYSIGVTLYEMLTGATPFKSPTGSHFEVQKAHLEKIPPAPSTLKSSIPRAVDELIMKALAKNPAQRFPSACTFKEALATCSATPPRRQEPLNVSVPQLKSSPLSLHQIRKMPLFQFSTLKHLKHKIKMPDLKQSLTPAAQVMQEKVVKPIQSFDRRKWLFMAILIPLILLLLMVIAHAEPQPAPEFKSTSRPQETIHNHELIINFQAKTLSYSSSRTSRRNK